jgi:hypothetical protein
LNGTIDSLLWKALKQYPTEALFRFLVDRSYRVRMAAAHELQIRGEKIAFEWAKELLGRVPLIKGK